MFRQSLKVRYLLWIAVRQAPCFPEQLRCDEATELNQPDHRQSDQREEAHGESVVIAQDAKALDPADRVLDHTPLTSALLVWSLPLLGQLPACGFLVGSGDLRVVLAAISFVTDPELVGAGCRQGGFLVQLEVSLRPAVTRIALQDCSLLVSRDLRLERVAFLLPRIEALLSLVEGRPADGCLKAINDHLIDCLRCPGRLTFAPSLLRLPLLSGKQVATDRHDFVERILRSVSAEAKERTDHRVVDIMAQIDERPQH